MKFTHIIWIIICMQLAIGFTNTIGIFDTNYMTSPEDGTWVLSDVEGTLNQSITSDADAGVTDPIRAFGMLKDLVVGCFYVYEPLTTVWRAPEAIAVLLQTIVAVSWVLFLVQLVTRFSWGGVES